MPELTVTHTGRITLPPSVRDALDVQNGGKVRCVIHGDEVRLLKARSVSRLYGILRHDGAPVPLADMERAIAEGAASE